MASPSGAGRVSGKLYGQSRLWFVVVGRSNWSTCLVHQNGGPWGDRRMPRHAPVFVPGGVVSEDGAAKRTPHAPSVGLMQLWRFIRITGSITR